MASFSLKCMEVLCVLYSGLLFLSGALLIGFSVVLTYKLYHFKFVPSDAVGPFIVLFLLGFIHLLLTWLGVKGPTREHDFHIILFIAVTIVLIVIEVIIGIWSLVLWRKTESEVTNLITDSFKNTLNGNIEKQWISIQSELECCGINGPTDYRNKESIPLACCSKNTVSHGAACLEHNNGCKQPLVKRAKRLMIDASIMGFLSGIFQIGGVILFYYFMRNLQSERKARTTQSATLQRRISETNAQPPVTSI